MNYRRQKLTLFYSFRDSELWFSEFVQFFKTEVLPILELRTSKKLSKWRQLFAILNMRVPEKFVNCNIQ